MDGLQFTARQVLATFENFVSDVSGLPISDTGWFNAAIYESFLSARATLVRAEHEKDSAASNKYVLQNLGCLELEEVRTEECPCAPPSGCTWFRTTLPIPLPIGELHSVTSIGGNLQKLKHYTYRDWHTIKFSLQARNEAERTRGYYTIKNSYIYLASPKVHAVSISGVFYDPVETQRHPQCGVSSTCQPFLDYPIYIDPAHYQALLISTYQLISGMKAKAPLDTKNNAQQAVTSEPT